MITKFASRGLVPAAVACAVIALAVLVPAVRLGPYSLTCYSYAYGCGTPTVTNVSPNVGSPSGGTTVTVTGTNFNNSGLVVRFGATPGTGATIVSDTKVTVVSPAHAAGTVDVTVTTAAGTSATSAADQFTYFTNCATSTATANPAASAPGGTIVHITAVGTACGSPLFEFWIKNPGGLWNIAIPYSARNNWNWDTRGPEPAGIYYWSVWVKDASSANAYDTFVPGSAYTLTTAACTAVSAVAVPSSTQNEGTAITITAAGTCPNTAMYEFWLISPASAVWQVGQSYSTSNTFTWNTTANGGNGGYHWSVWVKDSSSTGTHAGLGSTYDTYQPGLSYQIN